MNRKCSPCYCITHRVRSLRWGCPPRKECGMSNIKFSNSSPRPFYERIIFVPPLILRKDHLMLGNDENTPKNEIPFPWPGTWLSCHMHTHSIHTTKTQEKKNLGATTQSTRTLRILAHFGNGKWEFCFGQTWNHSPWILWILISEWGVREQLGKTNKWIQG